MTSQETTPLKVFVSYRRSDSPGHAGRIQDALRGRFGKANVFYDVATLQGGVDFTLAIKDALAQSDLVVVILGREWARRSWRDRLTPRADWVRFEIEYARQLGKPILPVVVGGAAMPSARSLPPALAFLTTINAALMRDESWDPDVERLLDRLPAVAHAPVTVAPAVATAPRTTGARNLALAASALALTLAALTIWWPMAGRRGGPARANLPPTAGTIDVSPLGDEGLMSATRFVFTAQGVTDPENDPIRYTWDFGDGSPAPKSAASVTKVYDRVNRFDVKLLVNDGRHPDDVVAAQTEVTIRDVTGTWVLTLDPDRTARFPPPSSYVITLTQQGNQLSGRIVPAGSRRSTALIGHVEHPARVYFGSEHAWWADNEDGYFDLTLDLGPGLTMQHRTPGDCGLHIPCKSAIARRQ
jgi:hypothetical protein